MRNGSNKGCVVFTSSKQCILNKVNTRKERDKVRAKECKRKFIVDVTFVFTLSRNQVVFDKEGSLVISLFRYLGTDSLKNKAK